MEYMWAAMGATSDACPGDIAGGTNTGGYNKGYAGSTEPGGGQVNIGNYVWDVDNSSSTTHTVGSKLANELGLYDMSGNVWQWIWDAWDGATGYNNGVSGAINDPVGYHGQNWTSGYYRVLRGGAWNSAAYDTAVANRSYYFPYSAYKSIGFHVVRQ